MRDSAGVEVLQSLQDFSDEERHLLLHQLIVGDKVVKQAAVLQTNAQWMVKLYPNSLNCLILAGSQFWTAIKPKIHLDDYKIQLTAPGPA